LGAGGIGLGPGEGRGPVEEADAAGGLGVQRVVVYGGVSHQVVVDVAEEGGEGTRCDRERLLCDGNGGMVGGGHGCG
jgi:hypothetical protein